MATPDAAQPAALLEREHEVERVRAALQAVGRRAGGVLVIEGTAGIGTPGYSKRHANVRRSAASAS